MADPDEKIRERLHAALWERCLDLTRALRNRFWRPNHHQYLLLSLLASSQVLVCSGMPTWTCIFPSLEYPFKPGTNQIILTPASSLFPKDFPTEAELEAEMEQVDLQTENKTNIKAKTSKPVSLKALSKRRKWMWK